MASTPAPTPPFTHPTSVTQSHAEPTTNTPSQTQPPNSKPPRIHACLPCQQRKVRCDRNFPCAHCIRAGPEIASRCVPASQLPNRPPRRRRFAERELLDRIRRYEGLLKERGVRFEPLHPESTADSPAVRGGSVGLGEDDGGGELRAEEGQVVTPANLWQALSQKHEGVADDDDDISDEHLPRDNDDDMSTIIRTAWDRTHNNAPDTAHHFLFGSPASTVAVAAMHPDQARIFRLWQFYLDNVNPLLKVTHTPTLQARIIDAVGNLGNISAPLEALMFSIYCVAVLSLTDSQCESLLGSPKRDLLSGYQFACRQALLDCNVLQSSDHDCLTALFLYLVSIKPTTDPRALSSLVTVAIHGTQRLGYHREAMNASRPALEGELRRRLWWSLVSFEQRVCETYNHRTNTLSVVWNCHVPLNLNDFELLPGTTTAPLTHDRPTEALFVLLRSQLADCLRRVPFHLGITDPYLATLAPPPDAGNQGSPANFGDMQLALERTLSLCDIDHNPLHFTAAWTARGFLAKCLLLEYSTRQHARHNNKGAKATASIGPRGEHNRGGATEDEEQDEKEEEEDEQTGLNHALTMLRCDTTLLSSPMTFPFRWYIQWYFPFLAYIYIVQYLIVSRPRQRSSGQEQNRGQIRQSPNNKNDGADYAAISKRCWDAMSENYEARGKVMDFTGRENSGSGGLGEDESKRFEPLYRLFAGVILRGWDQISRVGSNGRNDGGDNGGEGENGMEVPRIVAGMRKRLREMQAAQGGGHPGMGGEGGISGGGNVGVQTGAGMGMSGMGMGGGMAGDAVGIGADGGGQGFMGLVMDQGGYSMDLMMGDGQMGFGDMQQPFWPGADWVM
ncbi:uncharacterized protein C8A04DRAFT_15684 [Dichotomopilus funicola]|uniref:Zn(2)-C6 fungal-type domain-containing protein n=1 Tax=Dichotomopilus funicola TaxID=1934379 RepID=A0AAN6UV43_9PEZI|nr:hypothetical protein C8A04DRAFT_15684 [Dichotomopilus funicola]